MIQDHTQFFTEQGSSASQMTAAKVMDIISSLPGSAGQAADAVSAYTQVAPDEVFRATARAVLRGSTASRTARNSEVVTVVVQQAATMKQCQHFRVALTEGEQLLRREASSARHSIWCIFADDDDIAGVRQGHHQPPTTSCRCCFRHHKSGR